MLIYIDNNYLLIYKLSGIFMNSNIQIINDCYKINKIIDKSYQHSNLFSLIING